MRFLAFLLPLVISGTACGGGGDDHDHADAGVPDAEPPVVPDGAPDAVTPDAPPAGGPCENDFDCASPSTPICDTGLAECVASQSICDLPDDPSEEADDGPAGATRVDPAVGATTTLSAIACHNMDVDTYAIDVPDGGDVRITLTWADAAADLDLYAHKPDGAYYGFSWWENPEQVRLTYLPAGRVYFAVLAFTASEPVPYTVEITRNPSASCASVADCAAEYRNQYFRGTCAASGACESITGDGMIAVGERCDSSSDCVPEAALCAGAAFMHAADVRAECTIECATDPDCSALGPAHLCSGGAGTMHFCLQPCAIDQDCLVNFGGFPDPGEPFAYMTCDTATGRCNAR